MRKIIFVDGLHNVFFVVSVVVLVLSVFSFLEHLYASFDFTVQEVNRVCEMPLNNRCEDHYQIIKNDGNIEAIVPSGYKFKNGDLAIRNHLKKNKLELSYQVNEVRVQWEYLLLHIIGMSLSCLTFILWQVLSRKIVQ